MALQLILIASARNDKVSSSGRVIAKSTLVAAAAFSGVEIHSVMDKSRSDSSCCELEKREVSQSSIFTFSF